MDEGNTWKDVPLKRLESNGNLWHGTIPAFSSGTTVAYYTSFEDEFENISTEVKPNFRSNHFVIYADGKKFMFPTEDEMVLTYEYKTFESVSMKHNTKDWLEYGHSFIPEKGKILKTHFAQDEDYYYFLIELSGNEKDVLGFYSFTGGVEAGILFFNADGVEKHPQEGEGWGELHTIDYWMVLAVDFYDTREANCRLCITDTGPRFKLVDLPDEDGLFLDNKVYLSIEKVSVPGETPLNLIKLQSAICAESNSWPNPALGGGRPTQISETSYSYVYLRTHSYEL